MTWRDAMTTWQVIYAIENRGYNYRSILSREKVLTIHFDGMKCEIDFVVVVCFHTSSTVILRSLFMSQAPKIPATSWALPSEIVEKNIVNVITRIWTQVKFCHACLLEGVVTDFHHSRIGEKILKVFHASYQQVGEYLPLFTFIAVNLITGK